MSPAEQPLPEGTDSIIEGAGVGSDEDGFELGAGADETSPVAGVGVVAGSAFSGESQSASPGDEGAAPADFREALFGRFDTLRGQASDRARDLAVAGKDRATAALDDLVRMVEQAADEVDEKVGAQYGDYARRAAQGIGSFADAFKDKDVDELFADAREFLKKSPGVAIGTAAALGFVVARLVRAGIDAAPSAPAGNDASAA